MKKIFLSITAAVLLAVGSFSAAFAAEDDPLDQQRLRGEVVQVDPDAGKFRLETRDGSIETVFTASDTRFGGKLQSLDEMEIGWKVWALGNEEDGRFNASVVVAGDLENIITARGKITEFDASAGKFRIENRDGVIQTFFVYQETRYGGLISGLEDLEIGWLAGVAYLEVDGKNSAALVLAGDAPDLYKVQGEVTEVDPGSGKFRLQTQQGNIDTFFVDEATRYQGQLSDLKDLEPGWKAVVAAKEGDDGKMTAVLVIAGERPEVTRLQGTVTQVDPAAGKFRIESGDGTVTTFFTDENTRYKGKISSLQDLEAGARAGVGAVEKDGKLIARILVAGQARPESQAPGYSPEAAPLEIPAL
jgi:hypothetical protein